MNKVFKVLRIILLIAILLFIAFLVFLFSCNSGKKATNNIDDNHAGIYVDGSVLRKADGSQLVLRGINHAHCWYQDQDEIAFEAIENTGANCIRIVLSDGDRWDRDSKESVTKLLELSKEYHLFLILEVHDGTGDDSFESLEHISDFWIELADVLKGTEDYCIVNIANEWVGKWDSDSWREGYVSVIPKLREAGINNCFMVDAAGWGQYGRSIRHSGMEVFEADPLRNTMFSVHMYGASGRYNWLIRYNLKGATNQNLCVCVGEFGYKHSDGDVKEDYLLKYCYENQIGILAWSWKGNSGGVEYLDLSSDWEGNNLTPEWGERFVNGEFGLQTDL